MTLEDFEKSLAEERKAEDELKSHRKHGEGHRHHSHHKYHHNDEDRHRHKRRKHSRHRSERGQDNHGRQEYRSEKQRDKTHIASDDDEIAGVDLSTFSPSKDHGAAGGSSGHLQRDSWMEAPSALDIDYTQKGTRKPPEPIASRSPKAEFELKIHDNELNKHHLQDLAEGKEIPVAIMDETLKHEVNYRFGDAGAKWRMTKLKAVHRRAEEMGKVVDDVAAEQYGNLRAFDDAREEQIELERRETYGEGYVGKEKPSGELFEERKLATGIRRRRMSADRDEQQAKEPPKVVDANEPTTATASMSQTDLNRLKAQMLKAKVRGAANAADLESEYNRAMAKFSNQVQPDVMILGAMDNRMLAGSRKGEVTNIDNKRGRERGFVEENEDMSIEDMVKQERRTRYQAGGDGQRFAERIAKDAKFDNDLDYMDENANKLAKRVQKSEINLKNTAVSEFRKMNRILDNCPLCHHEDTDTPPVAPVVSLATRVYLTLPTEPELSEGGASIIPVQHRGNLLECDDDEWEEIRVCSEPTKRCCTLANIVTEFYEKPYAYVS